MLGFRDQKYFCPPGFLGKTQKAFTLSHVIDVFYVYFLSFRKSPSPELQPLYSKMFWFSYLFWLTVKIDLVGLHFKGTDVTNILNNNKGFVTHGLLYFLIQGGDSE